MPEGRPTTRKGHENKKESSRKEAHIMLKLYDNGIYLDHGETICYCP